MMKYAVETDGYGHKNYRLYDGLEEAREFHDIYAERYRCKELRLLEVKIVKVLATSDKKEAKKKGLKVTELMVK